jgi:hypothetical protein
MTASKAIFGSALSNDRNTPVLQTTTMTANGDVNGMAAVNEPHKSFDTILVLDFGYDSSSNPRSSQLSSFQVAILPSDHAKTERDQCLL